MKITCKGCNRRIVVFSKTRKFCSRCCFGEYYSKTFSGFNSQNFGYRLSEGTKLRISQSKLGKNNPMYGKKPWNKNLECSDETKSKISNTKKLGFKIGKLIPWNKNKKGMQVAWNKGLKCESDERVARYAKKIKITRKKLFSDPKTRILISKKLSKSLKNYYANNPKALERLQRIRANIVYPRYDTKIEKKIQDLLRKNKIKFLKHYPIYNSKFETKIDMVILDKKIAIYCDGDYWHNLGSRRILDAKINYNLKKGGWKVVRLWEHDINNNLDKCRNRIMSNISI